MAVLAALFIGLAFGGECVKNDPFDPTREIREGAYKGQCVDTSSVRHVKKLAEKETSLEVANVFYRGTWWTGVLRKNSVEKVLFHIVPFESNVPFIQAAHTQLRFLLKRDQPMQLRGQSPCPAPNTSDLGDIVISSTYTAPSGIEYEARRSLGKNYGIVTRLLATTDRAYEEITKDKSQVRQFKLELSPEEANRLLTLAITRASDSADHEFYHLFNNNCSTIVFDTLDALRARPRGVSPVRGTIWNIRDEFIEPSIKALQERKLITGRESEVKTLNEELQLH